MTSDQARGILLGLACGNALEAAGAVETELDGKTRTVTLTPGGELRLAGSD